MEYPKVATTRFVCEPFHADFTGRLTLSVLGNHLLNCAGQHASARGFGISRLNEEDYTWVLSRMVIEFESLPKQYEQFEIDTWVESVYRLFTDRNFELRDQSGHTLGYARTVWAMIGMKSRKPIDITTINNGAVVEYTLPDRPCPIEKPGRIKVTAETPSASFRAHYSDIDINGHVNSMRYIEHILDLFSLEELKAHPVRRFEIAYVTESYCGDQLDLFMERADDGSCHVELRHHFAKSVVCRAKILFA